METMVNKGVTQREGEKESITRIFLGQSENHVVEASDTLKPSPVDTSKVMVVVVIFPQKDDEQESAVPDQIRHYDFNFKTCKLFKKNSRNRLKESF